MANNFLKKTLGLFSFSLGTTLVASSVVSCGISLDAIMNRTVDPNVYRDTYSYNMTSWNTAHTMQAEDQRILSNTFDTLLKSDEYGRIYGSLAESTYGQRMSNDEKYPYVGLTNEDKTEWTYKIRDNAYWSTYNGEKVRTVEPSDIITAGKYALVSSNGSDVGSLWTSFIQGASEISAEIDEASANNTTNRPTKDIVDEIFNKHISDGSFGIVADDEKNTVTFKLTKPAPYFESLLTYSVFSPITDAFSGVITDHTKTLFNGPYLPKEVNPNGKIVLEKNPDYVLKDNVNIERLEFSYLEGSSSSRTRTLFESGSISGFDVKADDLKGWETYIGDDYENPVFEGAYSTKSPDTATTFLIFYNFYNSNMDDKSLSQYEQNVARSSSQLLQSNDVRAFLSTAFDRSKFVRYFSKTIDEVGEPSKMLRNTFTGTGVAGVGGKDYTEFVSEAYDEANNIVPNTNGDYTLKDGNDVFLDNSEQLTGKTREQLINDINIFIDENKLVRNSDGRVKLSFLLSPTGSVSTNPYVNYMIKTFNAIENNPIYIESTTPVSTDDYVTKSQSGKFDLFISGWSPDYKDPSSFLETLYLGGAYSNYNGNTRLFKKKSNTVDGTKSTINDYDIKLNSKYADGTSAAEDLLQSWIDYTDGVSNVDLTITDETNRYEGFAEYEYSLFYETFMALPLYTKAMPITWTVSHIRPYSKSYEAFGTAQFSFYGAEINEKLWNRKQIEEFMAEFNKNKAEVDKDWNTHRDAVHWEI